MSVYVSVLKEKMLRWCDSVNDCTKVHWFENVLVIPWPVPIFFKRLNWIIYICRMSLVWLERSKELLLAIRLTRRLTTDTIYFRNENVWENSAILQFHAETQYWYSYTILVGFLLTAPHRPIQTLTHKHISWCTLSTINSFLATLMPPYPSPSLSLSPRHSNSNSNSIH